jgi:hypothetical protein
VGAPRPPHVIDLHGTRTPPVRVHDYRMETEIDLSLRVDGPVDPERLRRAIEIALQHEGLTGYVESTTYSRRHDEAAWVRGSRG